MAKEVIKKDGTREPFDAEKIKKTLAAAAGQADLPADRQSAVVEQIANIVIQMADAKEEITTSEIKEKILSELDKTEPLISAAWRKHEEEK
ncbi:MAG: ATP cone domain-containing protein [Candidatus Nealsonbacteria bacterium]